jgi:hypothetical protein
MPAETAPPNLLGLPREILSEILDFTLGQLFTLGIAHQSKFERAAQLATQGFVTLACSGSELQVLRVCRLFHDLGRRSVDTLWRDTTIRFEDADIFCAFMDQKPRRLLANVILAFNPHSDFWWPLRMRWVTDRETAGITLLSRLLVVCRHGTLYVGNDFDVGNTLRNVTLALPPMPKKQGYCTFENCPTLAREILCRLCAFRFGHCQSFRVAGSLTEREKGLLEKLPVPRGDWGELVPTFFRTMFPDGLPLSSA